MKRDENEIYFSRPFLLIFSEFLQKFINLLRNTYSNIAFRVNAAVRLSRRFAIFALNYK